MTDEGGPVPRAQKKPQDSREFWEELERVERAAASPYQDDSHAFDQLHQFPGVVTHETILKLHKIALPGRDQVAGLYRGQHGHQPTRTIWVGNHEACQNQHVQREMDKFLNWLNEEEAKIGTTESMGLQKFVALVHYKIVKIHPFYAGNGRGSRVLMSFIMMRHGLGPFVIPEAQRVAYNKALSNPVEAEFVNLISFLVFNYCEFR